jgi:predicted nucleic-acid-binding protein
LRRVYNFERDHISAVLRKLTEHPKILLPDRDIVRDAAHLSREIGGDVADHMIALINRSCGCAVTYTFDEDAANSPDFALLPT